ncbi:MAG: DUF427 domain-containing protein [Acidimicrobiales bacterium]
MTLTLANGPLAARAPDTVNYEIVGPAHKILFGDFPRRVRARFGGETILDTTRGKLLHESNILPVLYVPEEDVRTELLEPTDNSTHCPFKGDAAYWTIRVGDRTSENAAWGYPEPVEGAEWLRWHVAFYWDRVDAWFDEDEEVRGHLRDPYHRVDVRRSSRQVVVRVDDQVIAGSARPMVLSETGLPTRFYLPASDVSTELLVSSTTTSHCPYKGDASYWSLVDGSRTVPDVAWSYHAPHDDARRAAGLYCFATTDEVTVEVDGQPVP